MVASIFAYILCGFCALCMMLSVAMFIYEDGKERAAIICFVMFGFLGWICARLAGV